jgi:hypothetical protein
MRERLAGWHRPLLALTALSVVMGVVCVGGLAFDDRVLTGAPIWMKPFKFSVSIAIYAFTIAWLLTLLRFRRLGWWLGTIISVMLGGELVLIVVQVIRGTTSHFNYATPLDATIFNTMAGMIVTLWVANLAIGILLLFQRLDDRSLAWSLRLGTLAALVGMAVAFFMPQPTPEQETRLDNGQPQDIIGAHSVGIADGGPGLPIVGWSTVGGDLRVAHFLGIHALQAIPLLAFALVLLASRFRVLDREAVRTGLVVVAGLTYLGVVVIATWQALRGQSVVRPDGLTLGALAALVGAAGVSAGAILGVGSRSRRNEEVRA